MAATQEPDCPFLELPAELRNEVYELVFMNEQPIDLDDKKTRTIEPPLLQVCRQIRGEARQLYQCHAMYQTDRTATAARLLKKISRQELALFKGLNIRAPQGDREQDGDGAEIEEEYVHCFRKVRLKSQRQPLGIQLFSSTASLPRPARDFLSFWRRSSTDIVSSDASHTLGV